MSFWPSALTSATATPSEINSEWTICLLNANSAEALINVKFYSLFLRNIYEKYKKYKKFLGIRKVKKNI